MRFSRGDRFTYDTWRLTDYGNLLLSSHARHMWRVLRVGDNMYGSSGVTTVIDSVVADSSSRRSLDTLYFQFAESGDIAQYGALARLVQRREGRKIPKGWDRIAAFSGGVQNPWLVGWADSALTDAVHGQIAADQQFFLVMVNTTQTLVSAYRIDLTGSNLQYSFFVCDDPSLFVIFRDESSDISNGEESDVVAIYPATSPG